MVEVRNFAIRRVNPFLGVLQVVETAGGRATSTNGVVWDIEIRAERETSWGSLGPYGKQLAYYRYGLWSLQEGLVTRPLSSHLNSEFFTKQCNILIDNIRKRLDRLPFSLEDHLELWLFDQNDQQPLALLATVRPGQAIPSPEPRYWTSSIGAAGVPGQRRHPDSSALETMVKQRAGFNIKKHWVRRQDDGSGIIEANGNYLKRSTFPAYLLSTNWPEADQEELAGNYVEWISPSLLTLQNLSNRDRAHLENNLNRQAESVEHHWHLYPEFIDEECIRAARVQCRLQKANQAGRTAP